MKYLLKSSFALILLMAVFNIGVTNAYAEKAKAPETNTDKTITLKIPNSKHIIPCNNIKSIAVFKKLDCENAVTDLPNGGRVITTSSCDIIYEDPDGNIYFLTDRSD